MSDYEAEILQMRSEMEQLQCKLSEAERQLQFNHNTTTSNSSSSSVKDEQGDEAKEVVARLMREEDKLRREHLDFQMTAEDPMSDKERMIMMQQKKIAALDAANRRLLDELNKLTTNSSSNNAISKVSVTTSPINVTSINTSSNTVSHDRRVSSSSTSSNKSITVITNGEASTTTVKANSLPNPNVSHSGPPSQETPKTVDELLDS